MLKQTIQLFIKALVVGILLNLGLQQMSVAAPPPDDKVIEYEQPQQTLPQSMVNIRVSQSK